MAFSQKEQKYRFTQGAHSANQELKITSLSAGSRIV
jgi:hypothetical protein